MTSFTLALALLGSVSNVPVGPFWARLKLFDIFPQNFEFQDLRG